MAATKHHRTYELHPEDPTPTHSQSDAELQKSVDMELYDDAHQSLLKGDLPEPILPNLVTEKRANRSFSNFFTTLEAVSRTAEQRKRLHFIGKAIIEIRGKADKKLPLRPHSPEEMAFISRLDRHELKRVRSGLAALGSTNVMQPINRETNTQQRPYEHISDKGLGGLKQAVDLTKEQHQFDRLQRIGMKKNVELSRLQGNVSEGQAKVDKRAGKNKLASETSAKRNQDAVSRIRTSVDEQKKENIKKLVELRNKRAKQSMALELKAIDKKERASEINKAAIRLEIIETELENSANDPNYITPAEVKALQEEKSDLEFYVANIKKPYGKRKR